MRRIKLWFSVLDLLLIVMAASPDLQLKSFEWLLLSSKSVEVVEVVLAAPIDVDADPGVELKANVWQVVFSK